jgi:iron(III) transport system substrate-binding protein
MKTKSQATMIRMLAASLMTFVAIPGCWSGSDVSTVVVYTALDAEFSQPILEDFQRESSIKVLPKFDAESTKTLGLTTALISEAKRPRCDVFWNNEILNTLRLEERGLVDVYLSPAAQSYPPAFRSPHGTWHGFAARARVLIVNTEVVSEDERPEGISDMTEAKWRGRCGLAKPLFGTTATHAACLFALWGRDRAEAFFDKLKANDVQILLRQAQSERRTNHVGQQAGGRRGGRGATRVRPDRHRRRNRRN